MRLCSKPRGCQRFFWMRRSTNYGDAVVSMLQRQEQYGLCSGVRSSFVSYTVAGGLVMRKRRSRFQPATEPWRKLPLRLPRHLACKRSEYGSNKEKSSEASNHPALDRDSWCYRLTHGIRQVPRRQGGQERQIGEPDRRFRLVQRLRQRPARRYRNFQYPAAELEQHHQIPAQGSRERQPGRAKVQSRDHFHRRIAALRLEPVLRRLALGNAE